jgi:hypothetical protein
MGDLQAQLRAHVNSSRPMEPSWRLNQARRAERRRYDKKLKDVEKLGHEQIRRRVSMAPLMVSLQVVLVL